MTARRWIEAMHAKGWWPHPKPRPLAPAGPPSPPNADWQAAKAKIRGETDAT